MFFETDDYEDISIDGSHSSDGLLSSRTKPKHGQGVCAICGVKSTGINFDVLTCSSCKAFFRRNGIKPMHKFNCRLSGDCIIDERTRRQCTACRLQKCFSMGMVKERIRTDEQNQRHRALVEKNRRQKMSKFGHKKTEEKQFKILDEHHSQSISATSSFALSSKHLKQIDFIFESFLDSTQRTIFNDFVLRFDSDLTDVLNQYCEPISCLLTSIKQLSQFQQLPVDDRLILLKNNTKILLPILTCWLNTTADVQILVTHPGLYNVNNKIAYAYSLFACLVPGDAKLLALLLAVFLFCPCLFTDESLYDIGYLHHQSRQSIQCAYDEYTQLIWYYLLEKFADDEDRAIFAYLKIVTTFLRLQTVTSEIYDVIECSIQIDRLHMIMQSILHLT